MVDGIWSRVAINVCIVHKRSSSELPKDNRTPEPGVSVPKKKAVCNALPTLTYSPHISAMMGMNLLIRDEWQIYVGEDTILEAGIE